MHNKDLDKSTAGELVEIKNVIIILLVILFLSLGGTTFRSLFDTYIVDRFIRPFYKDRLNTLETVITLLATFYGLYLVAEKISQPKYKVRTTVISLMAIPFVMYLYERLINNQYEFTKILDENKFDRLRFLDFPFGLLAVVIIVLIVNRLQESKASCDNDLIIDLPLKLVEDDDYEREQVYEGLLNRIASIKFEENKSFCIGIANSWGEGKTSFLNFLEQRLASETDTIIIKFNPWFSSNSANLTSDFFNTIDAELSKYTYTGSMIRRYANGLTGINSVFNPFKYLPMHWLSEKSHQALFNDIDNLIKRIDKRIFVVIDDMDRLDNNEVFSLIRTIRNTGNFTKTHFVIPFDKRYVIKALNENKIFNPKEYLKKIFDVEIVLPPITKSSLQRILYGLFDSVFKDKVVVTDIQRMEYVSQIRRIVYDEGFSISRSPKYTIANTVLFRILKNKRDIIRFFNSIVLPILINYKWVYLPDLILLETIKYYDITIYKKLFENNYYLEKKKDQAERQYYKLIDENNKENDDFVESTINSRGQDFNLLNRVNNQDVKNLIIDLFTLPDDYEYNAKYAFAYLVNFDNYVQYRENGIKYEEIENLLNG